jgi:hypothetical protein
LPGLDGRSASARRFRDPVNAFVAMGGLDRCSEISLGLLRRLLLGTAIAGDCWRSWRGLLIAAISAKTSARSSLS